MFKKFNQIIIGHLLSFFLLTNIGYHYQTIENDDKIVEQIASLLPKYHLSIYADDVNSWDNPQELEKITLFELQQATSFLKNDDLVKKDANINYQKIKLVNGYKLDLAKQNLLVNFQYGSSQIKEFSFHVWEVKRENVIKAINQKIATNVNINKMYEENWNSNSFVNFWGEFYLKKLLNTISSTIEVDGYQIPLNYRRIFFEGWKKINPLSYQIILQYRYFFNAPAITLPINLRHMFNTEQIVSKIIPFLKKANLLEVNFPTSIKWNDKINWLEFLNNLFFKWLPIINQFLYGLKYQLADLKWSISHISPFGPFEQEITIFLSLNSSLSTVPLQVKFEHINFEYSIWQLQKSLQNKLDNLFILQSQVKNLTKEILMKIIQQNIGYEIQLDNQLVPFSSNSLDIEQWTIFNKQLLVNLKLKNSIQNLKIEINLI